MPNAGDEFDSYWLDEHASDGVARKITYRYRANGTTVDPVKIIERKIRSRELRFSDDPWQPARWVLNYGDETTHTLAT